MAKKNGASICLSHDLIKAIYDCVDDGRSWQPALDMLTKTISAKSSSLRMIYGRANAPREVILGSSPNAGIDSAQRWQNENPHALLPPNLNLGEPQVSFWNGLDAGQNIAEIRKNYGLDWAISVCIEAQEQSRCVLQCHRSQEAGGYTPEDVRFVGAVGEHFARAVALKRNAMNIKIAGEFQAQALDRMGIGGILIDPNRSVILLNKAAERIFDDNDGISIVNHKLVAHDHRNDIELQNAIRNALDGSTRVGTSRGLSLHRASDKRDLGVVVNTRAFRSLITNEERTCALIFVRRPECLTAADVEVIQQLFGFTRAEARLAVWLTSGMRLEDIESALKIRHNTARAHLRSMYCKTEVNRQSELIQLLASCAAPLGRSSGEPTHLS